ncbi:MAG: hypothetical protein JW738_01375 [Actinobacteria bacterium]|nr:hypothetical protein [Actinomycetota bacterium]
MIKLKLIKALYVIILIALLGLLISGVSGNFVLAASGQDDEVSSTELIENAGDYNETRVVYSGEVVGQVLKRGDNAWITVNDDHYSIRHRREYQELKGGNSGINIYCKYELVKDIQFVGSYETQGDNIRVEGVFYKSSPEHGGDLMIEAESLEIVRQGHKVRGKSIVVELIVTLVMGLVALSLGILWWKTSGSSLF